MKPIWRTKTHFHEYPKAPPPAPATESGAEAARAERRFRISDANLCRYRSDCTVTCGCAGGGLGGTRRGGADVNIKHSGREDNERERERYRLEQRDKDDRTRHDRERERDRKYGADRAAGGLARH